MGYEHKIKPKDIVHKRNDILMEEQISGERNSFFEIAWKHQNKTERSLNRPSAA
jgi:hypothetical protein